MRDIGLHECLSRCLKSELLIEGNDLRLSMQYEGLGALAFGFGNGLQKNVSAVSFSAFGGKHATENPLTALFAFESTCVGKHMSFAVNSKMDGIVIDSVEVLIPDVLLQVKDCKTRFEDFVQFGIREICKMSDM